MSDLNRDEAQLLHRALADSVPEPHRPEVHMLGLAARARQAARRTTRRRVAAVTLAAGLVIAAIAIPRLTDTRAEVVNTPIEVPAACLSMEDVTGDALSDETALWIRFCPNPGQAQSAPVSLEPIVAGAGPLVDRWRQARTADAERCSDEIAGLNYRVQIGFSDGSVGSATGVAKCPLLAQSGGAVAGASAFEDLLTAQGRDLAERYADPEAKPPAVECPPALAAVATNLDGASSELIEGEASAGSIAPIMPLTATSVTACRYDEDRLVSREHSDSADDAEQIRIALHGGIQLQSDPVCQQAGAQLPTMIVVLQDHTGTRRSFRMFGGSCYDVSLMRGVPGTDVFFGYSKIAFAKTVLRPWSGD